MMAKSRKRRGQGLVEYALILALVVLVVVTALTVFGTQSAARMMGTAANRMGNAT